MDEQILAEVDAVAYRAFLAFYEMWLENDDGAILQDSRMALCDRMSELAQWLDGQAQTLADDLDREIVTVYNADGEAWFLEQFEATLAPAGLLYDYHKPQWGNDAIH